MHTSMVFPAKSCFDCSIHWLALGFSAYFFKALFFIETRQPWFNARFPMIKHQAPPTRSITPSPKLTTSLPLKIGWNCSKGTEVLQFWKMKMGTWKSPSWKGISCFSNLHLRQWGSISLAVIFREAKQMEFHRLSCQEMMCNQIAVMELVAWIFSMTP